MQGADCWAVIDSRAALSLPLSTLLIFRCKWLIVGQWLTVPDNQPLASKKQASRGRATQHISVTTRWSWCSATNFSWLSLASPPMPLPPKVGRQRDSYIRVNKSLSQTTSGTLYKQMSANHQKNQPWTWHESTTYKSLIMACNSEGGGLTVRFAWERGARLSGA